MGDSPLGVADFFVFLEADDFLAEAVFCFDAVFFDVGVTSVVSGDSSSGGGAFSFGGGESSLGTGAFGVSVFEGGVVVLVGVGTRGGGVGGVGLTAACGGGGVGSRDGISSSSGNQSREQSITRL